MVDKVDIISLSLGSSVGWLDNSPIQIYQDYLATIGVHIVAAAGNERTEGLFYSEQPAAGLLTNAVGATYDAAVSLPFYGGRNHPTDSDTSRPAYSDPTALPAYQALLTGGGSGLIPYSSPAPLVFPAAARIYFTSTDPNLSGDACSALPASTPNLSDKVVIVRRGGCDFTVKLANVGKAGGFVPTLSLALSHVPADEAIADLAAKLSWSTTPPTPSSFLSSTSAPLAYKSSEVCATRKESRCVKASTEGSRYVCGLLKKSIASSS